MTEEIFYYIKLFSLMTSFLIINYFVLDYIEIKISSRIKRSLGVGQGLFYLKSILFKLLRDAGKKRDKREHLYPISSIVKPFILLIYIIQLLILKDSILGKGSLLIMLILYLFASLLIILDRASQMERDKIYKSLLNESLRISALIPVIVSTLLILNMTGIRDFEKLNELTADGWFLFRQPLGFLISFTALMIISNNIPLSFSGIKRYERDCDSYLSGLSESLSKFLITAFIVYLYFGGAKTLVFKFLVIPEEIVLIIKTYIFTFFIYLIKNSLPVLKFEDVFRSLIIIIIPISILNYIISWGFL